MTDVDKQGLDMSENKALEHKMHKTWSLGCMIKQAITSKRSKGTRNTGSKIAKRGSTLKGLRRGKAGRIFRPIMTIVLRQ